MSGIYMETMKNLIFININTWNGDYEQHWIKYYNKVDKNIGLKNFYILYIINTQRVIYG